MHQTMLMLATIMLKLDAQIDYNLLHNQSQIDKIGTKERLEQRPCGLFVLVFAVFGIIIRMMPGTIFDPDGSARRLSEECEQGEQGLNSAIHNMAKRTRPQLINIQKSARIL